MYKVGTQVYIILKTNGILKIVKDKVTKRIELENVVKQKKSYCYKTKNFDDMFSENEVVAVNEKERIFEMISEEMEVL